MFNKRLQIIQKLELVLEFGIFIENIENENQNRNNNIYFVLLNYDDKIKVHICGPIMIFSFKLFKNPIEQAGMVGHTYIYI